MRSSGSGIGDDKVSDAVQGWLTELLATMRDSRQHADGSVEEVGVPKSLSARRLVRLVGGGGCECWTALCIA